MQAELHCKDVRGNDTGAERTLDGGYLQAGVFFQSLWQRAPRPLEISGRRAFVDPDRACPEDSQSERLVGVNGYIAGHRNKISTDVGHLHYDTIEGGRTTDLRTRMQWEVTF